MDDCSENDLVCFDGTCLLGRDLPCGEVGEDCCDPGLLYYYEYSDESRCIDAFCVDNKCLS